MNSKTIINYLDSCFVFTETKEDKEHFKLQINDNIIFHSCEEAHLYYKKFLLKVEDVIIEKLDDHYYEENENSVYKVNNLELIRYDEENYKVLIENEKEFESLLELHAHLCTVIEQIEELADCYPDLKESHKKIISDTYSDYAILLSNGKYSAHFYTSQDTGNYYSIVENVGRSNKHGRFKYAQREINDIVKNEYYTSDLFPLKVVKVEISQKVILGQ